MKTKKHISIVFLFSICFLFKNTVFAQASSKNAPLFLLQGAVKQKGKPIQGVELLLVKDGKSVAKIITPKNGLYYFQLNKSSTDTQSEYTLKINKAGSVSGVLKINTYIPKDQFTTIPYLFYLDITFNTESTTKKDFGCINWFVEKNEFNFDKNYIPVLEKDSIVSDAALTSKNSLTADSSNNAKSFVQNNKVNDSLIAINATNSEDTTLANTITNNINTNAALTDNITNNVNANSSLDNTKQTLIDPTNNTFVDIINTTATNKSTATNTDVAKLDKTKNDNSIDNKDVLTQDKLKNDEVLNSSFIKNTNTKSSTNIANSKSFVKTTDSGPKNTASKNNSSLSVQKNQQVLEKQTVNSKQQNKTVDVASKINLPFNNNNSNNNNTSTTTTLSKRDSLAANSSIQKDLFFLTGVPMGQFKTNLPLVNQGDEKTEVFDANEVFSTNSERSHALSEKQRFERKKAENLAKKHETNNTLTSLMNEVDEFDKKNK